MKKTLYINLALWDIDYSAAEDLSVLENAAQGIENIAEMSTEDMIQLGGIKEKSAKTLRDSLKDYIEKGEKIEEQALKLGFAVAHINGPNYPPLLKNLPGAPRALYVKGRLPDFSLPTIAVVGARKADAYGREAAYSLAKEYAKQNCVTISGMARGIDGAAHAGTLAGGGKTIAVLGCGLDVIYPPEHRKLYEKISESGAVISEYPPGIPPLKRNFPRRNRIIAGMSLGVIVVQADMKSGSLSTANFALSYGREVFAVPGSIFSPLTKGTHQLIKDGAYLVDNALEALNVLGIQTSAELPLNCAPQKLNSMPDLYKKVYISADGMKSIDSIIEELNESAKEITAALSCLEAEGYLKRLPGGIFIKS